MSTDSKVGEIDDNDPGEGNLSIQFQGESSRLSIDTNVNLNDDLEHESDISEVLSRTNTRRPESTASFRNSIDGESSFSSSAYFQNFNTGIDESNNGQLTSFSPLGPNSIYELTIASDVARERRRAGKTQVTLNGGATTVYNIKVPTTRDIPQIQLQKLIKKVNGEDIKQKLINDIDDDYKDFDRSYKSLTADTLQKFIQEESTRIATSSAGGELSINQEDSIPEVFSDSNFRLDDPRIFKQVIGDCNILPDLDDYDGLNDTKQGLANNNQLQEQLSHYLDLVEIDLIQEISKSSSSFFSTIEDIKTIQVQSNECVDQFQHIKNKLDFLENDENKAGLKILNQINERKNVESLESSMIQIKYTLSVFDLAQKSFNEGYNAKCLNEIVLAENLIHGTSTVDMGSEDLVSIPHFKYPLIDISNLPALFNVQSDLQNLKNQCSKGYIMDFNNLLITDLKDHYTRIPTTETLSRMYHSVDKYKKHNQKTFNNSYQHITEESKAKLKDYVENLVKSGHLLESFQSYQDRIIVEIKDIIKSNLPKSASTADTSNGPSRASSVPLEQQGSENTSNATSLSTSIRNLTPKEFELMLVKIFSGLSECLRRLTTHQKILLDLALSCIPPTSDVNVMAFDLTLAINKAIELTQLRLSKIINVRSEQIADLPLSYYLKFYSLCSTYLQECELINPGYVASGAGSSLNDWVKNHVTYFVHRFHSNNLRNISHDADREVWKEIVDESALTKSQTFLDEIISYANSVESNSSDQFSDASWRSPLNLYDYGDQQEPEVEPIEGKSRLDISNESFMVPQLALLSILHIRDYIIFATIFPHKASAVENNILNYFKLLNSKIAHSVLNAGATRTAGLKHITTKHLALCIQEVEFNVAIVTKVSHIFRHYSKLSSPPPQVASPQGDELTFVRVLNNFKDHETELCSKLVSIMYDRTLNHCQSLLKIDWAEPIKHPRQCHQYMETLVKETSTVAKVLLKYLPEVKYSLILSQIFNNYKKLLVECFCTQLPQFKDFNEKHSLLKDIDYFRVKLCDLPGYGTSGQVIWENVNSLPTVEDARMEEIMRNNIEGERKQNGVSVQKAEEKEPINDVKDAVEEEIKEEAKEEVKDVIENVKEVEEKAKETKLVEEPVEEVTEENKEEVKEETKPQENGSEGTQDTTSNDSINEKEPEEKAETLVKEDSDSEIEKDPIIEEPIPEEPEEPVKEEEHQENSIQVTEEPKDTTEETKEKPDIIEPTNAQPSEDKAEEATTEEKPSKDEGTNAETNGTNAETKEVSNESKNEQVEPTIESVKDTVNDAGHDSIQTDKEQATT